MPSKIFQKALERQGYDMARIPLVFQYNKRDLAHSTPIEELEQNF